jgi:hypothetical protein
LCAGEYAIGFLAYAVAYELRDARSWRERAWKLLPWCALLASYLIIRAALGFGTRGSGMYIDPLSESAAFFRAALVRLPISSGDLVLGIQANWWSAGFPWAESWSRLGFWPRTWAEDLRPLQLVQVWCGVVAMSIATSVCFALFRGRGSAVSARNRWVILATPLALLPSLSSVPESRLLLPPLFGWSILMGTCAWDCAMGWVGARQRGLHRVGGVALVTLVACQLIGPPFYVLPVMRGLPQLAQAVRSSILAPELDDTLRAGRRVLLLAAADPTTTIYLPLVRRVHGRPALGSCHLLTSAFAQQRLDRLSPTTFVIERLQTNMTPLDVYATAFNREPLQSAQQFTADGLQVTVERVLDGRPMRTRYKLDVSLDDPAVVLLQQTLSGLRRVSFPAVGHSVVLDPPVPPFALIANP